MGSSFNVSCRRAIANLPVIFITAHGSDQEVRARALAAGAVDYLLKPLKEDEVLKAIDAALSSK